MRNRPSAEPPHITQFASGFTRIARQIHTWINLASSETWHINPGQLDALLQCVREFPELLNEGNRLLPLVGARRTQMPEMGC